MRHLNKNPWAWVPTLYLAQGLPYTAVMTISVIMYKRLGLDNTSIALYTSLLYLPWVIKPIWSPFVDIIRSKRWWTLAMQIGLALGFASVAFSLSLPSFVAWSLAAFYLLAFLSATHDIASDGFYMLALTTHEQSIFVGIRTAFYRIAMILGQGGLVMLAGFLENSTGDIPLAWSILFSVLSILFVLFFLWHIIALPHPATDATQHPVGSIKDLAIAFANTFVTFFRKKGVWAAVAFILLYKLPEAQLVKLINPFLLDSKEAGGMAFDTAQVGQIYGVWGLIGMLLGGILGGIWASRLGLKRVLHPMAWFMSLTCVVFLILSYYTSAPMWVVCICVFIEQFGYGIGTTAFMLYLLFFSEGPNKTTHYALCTGIMSLGMMLPGMIAGWLQEQMGYQNFFIWTMICCVATIGIAYAVNVPSDFGLKLKN